MLVDQELDAAIRAGMFRDREHAFREAVETLFTVRPYLRTEAAVEMFRSGEVSLLRAAEVAGLDFESFRRLLQDRGISWDIECDDRAHLDQAIADFLREPQA
jgi:predicted HTH domain antitoxin